MEKVQVKATGLPAGNNVVGMFCPKGNLLSRTEVSPNGEFGKVFEIPYKQCSFAAYSVPAAEADLSVDNFIGSAAVDFAEMKSGESVKLYCTKGQEKAGMTLSLSAPGGASSEFLFEDDENKTGQERYKSFDNDACLGKEGCDLGSLDYLTDESKPRAVKGKPYILFFWAQFHKPGYKFISLYSQLADKYGAKVPIVGVSTDPDSSYPKKFLEDPAGKYSKVFPTTFAIAHDAGKKLAQAYELALHNTLTVPHVFLVGSCGKIQWHQDHSELGATVPTYMRLMETQIANVLAGKPLVKVGERAVVEEEDDEEEATTVAVADDDPLLGVSGDDY